MKFEFRQKVLGLAAVATLALGGLGTMAFTGLIQTVPITQTQPLTDTEQADDPGDTTQDPAINGSVPVDETQMDGMSEADEAAALQGSAKIDVAAAEAAAIAANPGTTVVKSGLESENGFLVYEVQLSNGMGVKVDAGDGAILHSEQDHEGNEAGETDEANDANEGSEAKNGEQDEAGDTDDLQDEHDGQPDDATETSGTEDAAGQ